MIRHSHNKLIIHSALPAPRLAQCLSSVESFHGKTCSEYHGNGWMFCNLSYRSTTEAIILNYIILHYIRLLADILRS